MQQWIQRFLEVYLSDLIIICQVPPSVYSSSSLLFSSFLELYSSVDSGAGISSSSFSGATPVLCVEIGYRCNNVGIDMYIIDKFVVYDLWVFYI